ncbi:MAG TPA: hypothetical protein VGF98_00640 [Candidatus Tumulicola sp.]
MALLIALIAIVPLDARSASTASLDLLRRAADPNPGLKSYTASAQLSATLHVLLPMHRTFDGTVYYLKPNRKIEFQNVTGQLARFKDLATSTPSFSKLNNDYTVTALGDTGTISTYSLVPKNTGSRVKSIGVTVGDASALIQHVQWNYTNGGTLQLTDYYAEVGTFQLPMKSDISARFPGYSVDGTLSFSNYKPNVTVSPAVFASPKA